MRLLYLKPELKDLSQGSRIAFVRQFRRLTQDYIAGELELSHDNKRRIMTRYEKGNRCPKDDRTLELSKILNVSFNAIKKYDFNKPIDLISGIEKYLPCSKNKKTNDFSGYVYTVKRDNGVRELYVKVLDGELHNRQEFIDEDGNKQKIRTVTKLHGDKRERADVLETGEIGIITGLNAKCGEIIGKNDGSFKTTTFVNPLFHTTVSIDDETKIPELATALETLNDEDPDLHLSYNKTTGQMSIDLMGPLQAEIIGNMLQERFSLNANFSNPVK